jgi:hypothetical protein
MLVVLPMVRQSRFKTSITKISVRCYLKNKLKAKRLKAWLEWQSTCLTSTRTSASSPVLQTNKQRNKGAKDIQNRTKLTK